MTPALEQVKGIVYIKLTQELTQIVSRNTRDCQCYQKICKMKSIKFRIYFLATATK